MKKIFKYLIVIVFLGVVVLVCFSSEELLILKYLSFSRSEQHVVFPLLCKDNYSFEDSYKSLRPGGRLHQGVDIMCNYGTPVLSAMEGYVVFNEHDILGGNAIKIFGIDNRLYYYAHLLEPSLSQINSFVKKGQIIGYVGNTGSALNTPPHLHLEIIEIRWFVPLLKRNINPYPEVKSSEKRGIFSNKEYL